MMRTEFIERTGFEPTAAEYEQIQQEYMGTDIDKDQFCKQWLKNGGIQRLSRMRARRIEELEGKLEDQQRKADENEKRLTDQIINMQSGYKTKIRDLEQAIAINDQTMEEFKQLFKENNELKKEAERKLEVLKEAFEILSGSNPAA